MTAAVVPNRDGLYRTPPRIGQFVDVFLRGADLAMCGYITTAPNGYVGLVVHSRQSIADVSQRCTAGCLADEVAIPLTSILFLRLAENRAEGCDCHAIAESGERP